MRGGRRVLHLGDAPGIVAAHDVQHHRETVVQDAVADYLPVLGLATRLTGGRVFHAVRIEAGRLIAIDRGRLRFRLTASVGKEGPLMLPHA